MDKNNNPGAKLPDGGEQRKAGGGGNLVKQDIDKTISKERVVIFAKSTCPYCDDAKKVFDQLGQTYSTVELADHPQRTEYQSALKDMTGAGTVPRVFVDGVCIGGGTDTQQLYQTGTLERILRQRPEVDEGTSSRTPELHFLQRDNMQRNLSTSLYWYVQKSLEDMVDGYMHFIESVPLHELTELQSIRKMNVLIGEMLDLPIEFDSTSRQLASTVILDSIQRHIKSTKACEQLLIAMISRKNEFAGILKADFLTLLEQVLLRQVNKVDYLKEQLAEDSAVGNGSCDETDLHPRVESHSYAQIFVELYLRELISGTQALVVLDLVSKAGPSYYHTELLLYLLNRIGGSVEAKVSRSSQREILRNPNSTPSKTNGTNLVGSKSTFESIYRRLESLIAYAYTPDTMEVLERLLKDRKNSRNKKPTALTRDVNILLQRSRKYPKPEKAEKANSSEVADQNENVYEGVTKL